MTPLQILFCVQLSRSPRLGGFGESKCEAPRYSHIQTGRGPAGLSKGQDGGRRGHKGEEGRGKEDMESQNEPEDSNKGRILLVKWRSYGKMSKIEETIHEGNF